MATPSEKLAQSLEELKKLQNEKGIAVVRANNLSRVHKDRLVSNGFLKEVIRGWYITSRPDEREGDATSWYASFWYFAHIYLNERFGDQWCLSPEQSLSLHSGNFTIPKQLLIRSPKANNNCVDLLHGTSFFDLKLKIPVGNNKSEIEGLNVYSISAGLVRVNAEFYIKNPTIARTCLAMIKDSSDVMSLILEEGLSVRAGRLAGAFRNIGNDRIADEIMSTMKSLGYTTKEEDPFKERIPKILQSREVSAYANRIRLMWHNMRQTVIDNFPKASDNNMELEQYLEQIDKHYTEDAYHSLSIEGYNVTTSLIEKVKSGNWNPREDEIAKQQKDAMAARGYFKSFNAVKESIKAISEGNNAGEVVDKDHGTWYRELFAPSVQAGLIRATDLAGYRVAQVYIRGSQHKPLSPKGLRDAMPCLFELLEKEENAAVRAVLGHFIFVYIHPYIDGNGRIARFLLNVMLFSGGYNWMVVPVERRKEYMAALEKASVDGDITDFARFLGSLVE